MNDAFLTRRTLLKTGLAGAALALAPGALAKMVPYRPPEGAFRPDVEIELEAFTDAVSILPGAQTRVQRYRARLLKGPEATLSVLPEVYLGPTLNFRQGQKVRITLLNSLDEPHITHWHGLHVPEVSDGHPKYTLPSGGRYVYEFEVVNRAGSSFYHSHTHELTAEQVYRGLAGMITVTDDQEQKLALPSGEFDLPLVLQDRSFTADNQLRYLGGHGMGGMHGRMLGFLGDTVLVNGRTEANFDVKSSAYRLRILNGSNARIYKLAFDDGSPLIAIGSDAGLLEKPETRPYLIVAPGERIDLWLDLSGRAKGDTVSLRALPVSGVLPGMMGGGHGRMGRGMGPMGGMMADPLAQTPITLARFQVTEKIDDSPKLPERLATIDRLTETDSEAIVLSLAMRPMAPSINGRSFEMNAIAPDERVALGSRRRIQLINSVYGMGPSRMMAMAHPMHFHGQQFQVISREQVSGSHGYDDLKDGFLDTGWKDTVLVMPGEIVEIIKPFEDYRGRFLFHCHNLEHEDLGMMRQLEVV